MKFSTIAVLTALVVSSAASPIPQPKPFQVLAESHFRNLAGNRTPTKDSSKSVRRGISFSRPAPVASTGGVPPRPNRFLGRLRNGWTRFKNWQSQPSRPTLTKYPSTAQGFQNMIGP